MHWKARARCANFITRRVKARALLKRVLEHVRIFSDCDPDLKGLSYEIDFENVDKNRQILALTRAAAGF